MDEKRAGLLIRVGMAIEAEFGGDFDRAPRVWFPSKKCEKYIIPTCDAPAHWFENDTRRPYPMPPPSFGQEVIELQEVGNGLHAYAGYSLRANMLVVYIDEDGSPLVTKTNERRQQVSTDNTIVIQKRLDGRWWVWMDLMSDETHEPKASNSRSFECEGDALLYAQGWLRGESVVEYGVRVWDAQVVEKSATGSIATCPYCGEDVYVRLCVLSEH